VAINMVTGVCLILVYIIVVAVITVAIKMWPSKCGFSHKDTSAVSCCHYRH